MTLTEENKKIVNESILANFTLSMESIGPEADEPAIFKKLLSDSSNWALTDRGNCDSYTPVWKLIERNSGEKFVKAAEVLKKTWEDDEMKREKDFNSENNVQRNEGDKLKAKEDLKCIKDRHLRDQVRIMIYLPIKYQNTIEPLLTDTSLYY